MIARPATSGDGLAELRRRHVVEEHGVGPLCHRLGKLIEIVDLDLDPDEVAGMSPGAPDRLADAAGDGDMVVLDEDGIVETEAVVRTATAAHRVFLERREGREWSCACR